MLTPESVSVPVPALVSPPLPASAWPTVTAKPLVSRVPPPLCRLTAVSPCRNVVEAALARSVPPLKLNVPLPSAGSVTPGVTIVPPLRLTVPRVEAFAQQAPNPSVLARVTSAVPLTLTVPVPTSAGSSCPPFTLSAPPEKFIVPVLPKRRAPLK